MDRRSSEQKIATAELQRSLIKRRQAMRLVFQEEQVSISTASAPMKVDRSGRP